jgi:hypothetical protein
MAVSSISSANPPAPPPKAAPVEAGEATRGGKDVKNDGDADDAAGAAAPIPKPTTNSVGQVIGQHLNVTA